VADAVLGFFVTIKMKKRFSVVLLCLAAGCKLPDKGLIDTAAPPFINQATTSPTLIDVTHIGSQPTDPVDTSLSFSASVNDGSSLTVVTYTLLDPSGNVLLSGSLNSNGGGRFSSSVPFHILKENVGTYSVQFQAVNDPESQSNIVTQDIIVKNTNHAPVVSNLVMADTVALPPSGDTTFVKITIAASDSDGQADIVSVTLTSQKPNGSSAGVFYLYDDGSQNIYTQFGAPLRSGDAVANDGIYTIVIPLTTVSDPLPTYRIFSFKAVDRTGAFSNVISKQINIIK
jgi:hypothetical protein